MKNVIKLNRALTLLTVWAVLPLASTRGDTAYPISRYIEYTYTLENESDRLVDRAEFWTYAPVKETSSQQCVNIRASHPYTLLEDELGNQILYFTFDELPPFAAKIIRIEVDLALTDQPVPLVADKKDFIIPAPYLEIDHPEFKKLAPRISATDTTERIEKTFKWVSRNVRDEGYVAEDRGALYALKNRTGDCTEFMYLFAALCRQQDIPARGVEGYVCTRNKQLHPAGYHSWAEVYQDGAWKLADPLAKVLYEKPSSYIAMRMVGDVASPLRGYHRFRTEGHGIKVTMNK